MATQPANQHVPAEIPTPKAGPSGATDQTKEREKKFDEEGGDQPQAKSAQEVEEELEKARQELG